MTMRATKLLFCSLLAASVASWNTDVHNQIGFMAETFLNTYTTSILHHILEPQYHGSIGRAAAWADAFAHTKEGRYSYQWHWIDSEDTPPASCNLNYKRDCSKAGCVVSAIANQTDILKGCIQDVKNGLLQGGTNLTCSYALKWVSHFMGDIAQPLHASGLAAGGNTFNVSFGNVSTELHAVWDGYIVYADANVSHPFSNTSISPFFSELVHRINLDNFTVPTHQWLTCSNPFAPLACAIHWARESNAWTCKYVYSQIHNNQDLGMGYAQGAYPIVELQVSKAALRLATWLNKLVGHGHGSGQQIVLADGII